MSCSTLAIIPPLCSQGISSRNFSSSHSLASPWSSVSWSACCTTIQFPFRCFVHSCIEDTVRVLEWSVHNAEQGRVTDDFFINSYKTTTIKEDYQIDSEINTVVFLNILSSGKETYTLGLDE